MSDSGVLIETRDCVVAGKKIGLIWLNRPAQLNALNLEMCQTMLTQMQTWSSDESIVAVFLAGKGAKGFSGGGDVAQIVRQVRAGGPQRFVYGDCFFAVEYQLDLLIYQYPKPVIAWNHGVTMGGGVGLSAGAAIKIVSEGARIAMPEIHIGLHPDVGGGWFLNRMPGHAGLLMALTGLVINEADALFAGLADLALPYARQDDYLQGLCALDWGQTARDHYAQALHYTRERAAAEPLNLPESGLRTHFDLIRDICGRAKLAGVMKGLAQAAAAHEYFRQPNESLLKGSPTAAAVSFEYIRRCRTLSIAQVLDLDLVMTRQFQRLHDFPEGVRALLIDKDRKPQWQPSSHAGVTGALVDAHFRTD